MKSLYQNLDFSFTVENIPVHVLTIALCRRVSHVPFHSHGAGCYELHYIVSGKGEIRLKDGYFHTSPHTFYMAGPHTEHAEISDREDPMTEYCLYFYISPGTVSEKTALLKALFSQDLLLGRNISRLLPLFEDLKEEMEKSLLVTESISAACSNRSLSYVSAVPLVLSAKDPPLSPKIWSCKNLS